MNRSASLVATERPKVPKSAQEFFNLPDRILLHGEIVVGKVGIGEISDGEVSVGKLAVGEIAVGEVALVKFSNTHFCVILKILFFLKKTEY